MSSRSRSGPMKATLPVSSLTRQSLGQAGVHYSPCLPHYHQLRARVSPEAAFRSCSTSVNRDKRDILGYGDGDGQAMRRTASLDTLYLRGHWPTESLYLSAFQVDRSTQTEDWLSDPRKVLRHPDSPNEDKLEKLIRHRMQRTKEGSSRERTAAFSLLGGVGGLGAGGESQQKQRMRSSTEGLNQEIERLVLRSSLAQQGLATPPDFLERKAEGTPEGHRAPLAELLRETRSVNTQTPALTGSPCGRAASGLSDSRPPSELRDVSEDSSPETECRGLGPSPKINRFLTREPPDGCERISTKFTEDRRPMMDLSEMNYPLKPSVNFQLKPSLGSAFQPLRSTQ